MGRPARLVAWAWAPSGIYYRVLACGGRSAAVVRLVSMVATELEALSRQRLDEHMAHARTFIVFRRPGPAWIAGRDSRQQPGWDAHAQFMDSLYESRQVLLGGPYADHSRALLIVACSSEADAEHLLDEDPWTEAGILETDDVHPWLAYLAPADWPRSD